VVGDDVDDQPHPVPAQFADKLAQPVLSAELRIDPRRVDRVVPMHRAWARGHDRRGIKMTDAEGGDVGKQGCGISEGEAGMELKAHRRAWRTHR